MSKPIATSLCVGSDFMIQVERVRELLEKRANEHCDKCGRGGGPEPVKVTKREAGDLVVSKGLEALKAEGFFDG